MIPMFAIVWGCIFFVFSFFQHTIAMRSMTRGHVWAFAYVGCPGGSNAPGTTLDTASAMQISHPGVASIIEGVIATILEIKWGHGTRHTRTARPRILGGDGIDQTDELYVMCNRVPRSNGDFFMNFVGQLFAH